MRAATRWKCFTAIAWRPLGRPTLSVAAPPVASRHHSRHFLTSAYHRLRVQGPRTEHPTIQKDRIHSDSNVSRVHEEPTIYALSTAPGRAAIAVIRVSGPACQSIYAHLCPGQNPPKPRYATVRTLYSPRQTPSPETILDSSALVLYFPSPRTVTGEDVLELHVHGGPAVVKAVLAGVAGCHPGNGGHTIRYAEPGEFTRRAFLNDRLDLTQVEALGDTLAATTEQQRRLSVRGAGNSLATRYDGWRELLLYARGELEALIDFSEDQHFDENPAQLCASVAKQVRELRRLLLVHSRNAVRGELLRNGIGISILGAPNVGKSSFLNRIVGREAAIVSQEAGTTRDVIEVGLDLGGYFCRLGDTAGLREAREEEAGRADADAAVIGRIEREGMRRAKERAAESDVVIVVLSLEQSAQDGTTVLTLDPEVVSTAAELIQTKNNVLVAINKADVARGDALESAVQTALQAFPGLTKDRIHLICCLEHDAGRTNPVRASSPTNDDHAEDPGGLQAFLRGLTHLFADLTAALTPDSSSSSSSSSSSPFEVKSTSIIGGVYGSPRITSFSPLLHSRVRHPRSFHVPSPH